MQKQNKITLLVIVFAVIVIVGFLLSNGSIVRINTVKPTISAQFVHNPDFNTFPPETIWYDNGNLDYSNNVIWYNKSIDGRDNLFLMEPKSETEARFIEQNVSLPAGKNYHLSIGLANVQGKAKAISPLIPNSIESVSCCADNGFRIKIISNGNSYTIADLIVNAKDGWRDLSYDISNYAGQDITVRIESYYGGTCNNLNWAWGAVDYVDIVSS
jgi:hypothetical protein